MSNECNKLLLWIAVDLDGTLAKFENEKWQKDRSYIGEPVPKMIQMVKKYLSQGTMVKIFTARAGDEKATSGIHKWLEENGLPKLEITNVKNYGMVKLYDNSCVQVMQNSGVTYDDILSSIIQPVVGIVRTDILRRMDKLANSSIEGRALAKVLERLFRFLNW